MIPYSNGGKITLNMRNLCLLIVSILMIDASIAEGQANSLAEKLIPTASQSRLEDMSGDGRFVIFTSQGDHTTIQGTRNNADQNTELFLFG
jgi:hypothetical protein